MKEAVIEEFFNQLGIAGILLAEESRSRNFSYGIYDSMDSNQRELLLQGVYQVTSSIPESFHCFEFQFASYQVNIYRLHQQALILMVLTDDQLDLETYIQHIDKLLLEIQESGDRAMSMFRFLASNWAANKRRQQQLETLHESFLPEKVSPKDSDSLDSIGIESLSGQIGRLRSQLETLPQASTSLSPTLNRRTVNLDEALNGKSQPEVPNNHKDHNFQTNNHKTDHDRPGTSNSVLPTSPTVQPSTSETSSAPATKTSCQDVLSALTKLSLFTTQYLGPSVVINYWKSSCPKDTWLQGLEIDRSAQFNLAKNGSSPSSQALDPEQLQDVKAWVASFIKRCSQVLRDFPTLLEQQEGLEESDKKLLM